MAITADQAGIHSLISSRNLCSFITSVPLASFRGETMIEDLLSTWFGSQGFMRASISLYQWNACCCWHRPPRSSSLPFLPHNCRTPHKKLQVRCPGRHTFSTSTSSIPSNPSNPNPGILTVRWLVLHRNEMHNEHNNTQELNWKNQKPRRHSDLKPPQIEVY